MDVLHVNFEVVIPGELLVAQLALCHGSVRVVGELVSAQHLLQAEGQVTHVTLKGFFSCVCPHVLIQTSLLAECLVTLTALIGFFPCVRAYMHLQTIVLAEGFVTVMALVWTFPCMAPDVDPQGPVAGKLLSTVRAYLLFFPSVCLLVALEHGGRDEGFLTQVTLVLLVSVVHHLDVDVERVLPLEGGVTLITFKRSFIVVDE